jgi:chemotaxis protein methyltransferase CheR
MKLLASERTLVFDYIYSISSIALEDGKDYLVEGRLSALAESAGARSFTELIQKAKADLGGTLKRRIIDGITTGETLFFRDTSPFDLLRHKLIPELIDRRNRSAIKPPIRIWSAACSTGQELYSIAILLREMLGDPSRHNFRLVGTDLSDEAVSRASAGYYNSIEMGRGLSDALRAQNFLADPRGWKIRDEIRSLTSFRRLNLMDDLSIMGRFDIIFCRNVAIYFNDKDRASLFQRLAQRLEAHGSLIIGSMESLGNLCPQLESKRHLRAVYYQLKEGKAHAA